MMNIEKRNLKQIDIRLYVECQKRKSKKKIDIRLYVEYRKTKVKRIFTFVFQYSTYSRMSKLFWLSFFDIHHDGECQIFFAFRFSIFEFEYRKAKNKNQTKLLLLLVVMFCFSC